MVNRSHIVIFIEIFLDTQCFMVLLLFKQRIKLLNKHMIRLKNANILCQVQLFPNKQKT
jgi:hypothetical protein